jgi:hypothetical protein
MEVDHTAREKKIKQKSRASYFANKNINTAASVKAYLFNFEYFEYILQKWCQA